jgi:hypothetical protein
MKPRILSGVVLAMFVGTLALAQEPKGVINKRQENQKARIKAGREDGSLTNKEAARLRAREAAIEAKEARDRADGKGFTAREKASITKAQNKLSKDISKQRNDKQTQ